MNDFDLILNDRLEIIRTANKKFNLEDNSYLSFSGGKDSTLLHYLIDLALPNNHIPRVFVNTGIEYNKIVEFIKGLAVNDDRFVILQSHTPVKAMLDSVGYPFKSKEHSFCVQQFQKNGISKTVDRYLNPDESRKSFGCPNLLRYQFNSDFTLKISRLCCYELKKKPFYEWQNKNNKTIAITGLRKQEGGFRKNIKGCILTDSKGNLLKFHPLLVVNDIWENEFIKRQNITLAPLYYEPFNFRRTGCVGCPYNYDLQRDLDILERLLPLERKKAEFIWKPVYEEYRRIGYRLNNRDYDEK